MLEQLKTDIVFLSETHLTDRIPDSEMNIDSYKLFRSDSSSRHTGGVAIYLKEDIAVSSIDRVSIAMNMWLICLKIKLGGENIQIACVYHSPNSCDNTFLNELDSWLQTKSEKLLLFGDVNIDWLSNNPNKKKIQCILNDNCMKQLVNNHTRITERSETLIDYCVSNLNNLNVEVKSEFNISDHECIICQIKCANNDISYHKQVEYISDYSNDKLISELKKYDWKHKMFGSFAEKCELFVRNLSDAMQIFIKKKKRPNKREM